MISKDPVDAYMERFEKRLRIRDLETKRSIMEIIKKRLEGQTGKSRSTDKLIEEFGSPEKLAKELSNPRNWVVDMGSPLSPAVDIDPFLSRKASTAVMIIFVASLMI